MEDQIEQILNDEKTRYEVFNDRGEIINHTNIEIGTEKDYVAFKAELTRNPSILRINYSKNIISESLPYHYIRKVSWLSKDIVTFEYQQLLYIIEVENSEEFYNLLASRNISVINEFNKKRKYDNFLSFENCKIINIEYRLLVDLKDED